ncbi:MAG: flagellin FliC [Acidibacter sp.]|jgi:flagellin|nr:flagellin FliC [Acidibacter sp.]
MAITANTNVPSIAASRAVYESRSDLTQAMERLSSGKRINASKDDAAGQTVVTRMRAQITSLNQAIRNANDGLSMVQTYDGAADEVEDMLTRMRELATLVQNGTYTNADRDNATLEFRQLAREIDRVQAKTKFNGTLDIASSVAASSQFYSFQVGFNGGDAVGVELKSLESSALMKGDYGSSTIGISSIDLGSNAVSGVDVGLSNLNVARATAGAAINRLEHTISNLMNVVQRTEEARSRIEDADFATESAALARANVLVQAGSAMLAQANQSPQYILALLR